MAVPVAVATKSRRSAASLLAGNRSRNADVVLADGGVGITSGAILIGVTSKRNRAAAACRCAACWFGNTDVARACIARSTVIVKQTSDVVGIG